jgi:putative NADH-flavin reductase
MNTPRIAVVGASGATGRHVLRLAAERGIAVTAVCRRPDALADLAGPHRLVVADAVDPVAMKETLAGHDTVVSLVAAPLGSPVGTVRSAAARAVVGAMIGNGGGRLVAVSSLGGAGSADQLTWAARRVFTRAVGAERLAEVDRQEEIVRVSGLDWVLVRPPRLVDAPAGRDFRLAEHGRHGLAAKLDRVTLAAALLHLACVGAPSRAALTVA